ncbi:MAG: hypothetical protein SNJ67_05150 [Chloracidobacterium sp.]|uniref:Uncharacterized protein n=1 Tax=Chloracidobacterium validum TaxID=2821543 RepID=A0ABX8B7M9_9BACT|nr:hypothetical protein [Chloracidobacterium validum]QUW02061.1 hypothetical protein J8C06_06715 [Chloracidobacterium validum]
MPTPIPDTPDVVAPPPATSAAALVVSGEETLPDERVAARPGESLADSPASSDEGESFKQLLRDFVLGNNQNPDDMPGLRFYIVFAGMLVLALAGVAIVATLIGFVRWLGLFFR